MEIILLVIVLVWYFGFYRKKGEKSNDRISIGSEADAVIEEALEVVNDFLNAGEVAVIFSDSSTDFRGHILYVPTAIPPFSGKVINYGFCIELCNVSDLTIGAKKYPKMLTNNPEFAEKYYNFINKYQLCFDSSKNSYVYRTSRSVPLTKGQKDQLYVKLGQQITKRCELADFSGGLLYTKNVYR